MESFNCTSYIDSENADKECIDVSLKRDDDMQVSSLTDLDEEDDHINVKSKCHKTKRVVYSDDEEIFEAPSDTDSDVGDCIDLAMGSSLIDVHREMKESDKTEDETVDNKDCDHQEITSHTIEDECNVEQQYFNNVQQECKDKNTKYGKKATKMSDRIMADENRTIQSEQQRLYREAHISVPYHKPKKHTLEEFLQRRTIIKPELINNNAKAASPTSLITDVIQRKKTSKMTAEELEIYAQHMEERAKECSEFFKSEDDNENFKNNNGFYNDNQEDNDDDGKSQHQMEIITCTTERTNVHGINLIEGNEMDKSADDNSDNVQQLTDKDLEEILQQEDPSIKSPKLNNSSSTTKINDPCQTIMDTSKKRPLINIRKLLQNEKLYEVDMIDLDVENINDPHNAQQASGTDRLMERLMKNCKEKRNSTNVNGNTKLEINIDNVPIKLENNKLPHTRSKPGEAYLKFKLYLKEIVNNKRLEELKKKQNENQKSEQITDDDDENCDDVNYEEDNELLEREEEEIQIVDEEMDKLSEFDDGDDDDDDDNDDYNDNDEDDDNDDDNDSNDDDDDKSNKAAQEDAKERIIEKNDYMKNEEIITSKNLIIIKPCCDENDSDNDDINFLKTQSPSLAKEIDNGIFISDELDVMNEVEEKPMTAIISQIPILQNNDETSININNEKEVEELIGLCSGSFQTQTQKQNNAMDAKIDDEETSSDVKVKYNKLLSSDGSNEEIDEIDENYETTLKVTDSQQEKKIKRLRKRVKKNRIYNVSISEDEDECKEKPAQNSAKTIKEKDIIEDVKQLELHAGSSIAFDSEESLIESANNEYLKQAEQFLDHEAQLSESDWDSADEDEENLDRYDMELGDEDLFDQTKLRHELEKIHARKMLDADIREVRQLQEMFLQDQEEGSGARQRQFRWKHINTGDFSLDDVQHEQQNESNEFHYEVNEEEISHQIWRKNRYEREKLLEKYKTETDINHQNSNDKCDTNGKRFQMTFKKNALNVKTTSTERMTQSSFLIAKDFSITRHRKIARQSFLLRDQEILHKVANLSKDVTGSIFCNDDITPTLMINTNKPKNFTFTTLTAEEHAKLKRKPKDALNSSNEQEEQQQQQKEQVDNATCTKKLKLERRNKCLIDQLL